MDEYCIVPKRVIDATKKDLPASHPAESKDVISLTGLINQILRREDDDWKKASILSSTLERYMALTGENRDADSFSIPQHVPLPVSPSVPSTVKVPKAMTAPLVRKQKRSAADVGQEKRLKDGPEVEFVPTPKPRPSLRQADVMDMLLPPDNLPAPPVPKPRSKVHPMVQMSDVMDLSDVFTEPAAVTHTEPVRVAARQPVAQTDLMDVVTNERRGKKRDRGIPVDTKLPPYKHRLPVNRKRSQQAPRLRTSKKVKSQEGGLKQRWLSLLSNNGDVFAWCAAVMPLLSLLLCQ